MSTIKENLIAAKALIDAPEKWIKNDLRNDDRTCFCVIGAVETAVGYTWADNLFGSPEVLALAAALRRPSHNWTAVSFFNDAKATTHVDVMALYDRAIAAQDGQP